MADAHLDNALDRIKAGYLTVGDIDLACSLVSSVDSETARRKWPSLHKLVLCLDMEATMRAEPTDPPVLSPARIREYEERYPAAEVSEVQTADVHLVQPRPRPPQFTIGRAMRGVGPGKWEVTPQFAYIGPCGPDDRRLTPADGWAVWRGKAPPMAAGLDTSAFGPWDSEDAAYDAAWQAAAKLEADRVATQTDELKATCEEAQHVLDESHRRKQRTTELHSCDHCRSLWHRQVDPALVLQPRMRIEVEDAAGAVLYDGTVEGFGPALVDAVTRRADAEFLARNQRVRELEDALEDAQSVIFMRERRIALLAIGEAALLLTIVVLIVLLVVLRNPPT